MLFQIFGYLAPMFLSIQAMAVPSSDVAVVRRSFDLENPELPTELASYAPALRIRSNNNVAMGVITSNTAIAGAACTFGGPFVCGGAVILAVISNFFVFYLSRSTPRKRDIDSVFYHEPYIPTANCGLGCKLDAAGLLERQWYPIGNMTTNGIYHDIHHWRSGNIRGLRAYQGGFNSVHLKRTDEDSDGGFVGDYYWISPNENAYDSFDSTQSEIQSASNDITNFMQSNNALEVCVDFGDSDGELNEGVLTLGWNNQAFQYSSESVLESHLAECQIGQMDHDLSSTEDDNL